LKFAFFFFKILFNLFDREVAQAGEAAGRGRQRSRLPAQQGAQCWSPSRDTRIMT